MLSDSNRLTQKKKRGSRLILKVRPSTCTNKHNPRRIYEREHLACLLPLYLNKLVVSSVKQQPKCYLKNCVFRNPNTNIVNLIGLQK